MLVLAVEPGSSAEAVGLHATQVDSHGDIVPGDIILTIDGFSLDGVSELLSTLESHRIGDPAILCVACRA